MAVQRPPLGNQTETERAAAIEKILMDLAPRHFIDIQRLDGAHKHIIRIRPRGETHYACIYIKDGTDEWWIRREVERVVNRLYSDEGLCFGVAVPEITVPGCG